MRRSKKYIALCMAAALSLTAVMPVAAGSDPAAGEHAQAETLEDVGEGQQEGLALEGAFPDPVFREYIAEHVDTDGDGILSRQEVGQVTELPLSGLGIKSLEGIGHFTSLEMLDCSNGQIGAVDLSGLEHLYALACTGNQVTLSVDEAGQVDLSQIPDMDLSKIQEISLGTTWQADGIVQLPQDLGEDRFTYVYDTDIAGIDEQQAGSWCMEVTVNLEGRQAREIALTEDTASENRAERESVSSPSEEKTSPAALDTNGQHEQKVQNETVPGRRLLAGSGVTARSDAAVIKSCKILSNKQKVRVKARIPKQVKSQDKYYYLFASSPAGTKLAKKPLARVAKKKSVTFTAPLKAARDARYKLQSRFQVAVKVQGRYQAISKEKYISNPEMLASSTLPFTKGDSKKGLQFNDLGDALQLGMQHCLYNVYITELMQPGGLRYKYKGKTYDFNQGRIMALGGLFQQLQNEGIELSVEFLLPWADGQTDLIHPAARSRGAHNYYAWNISSQAARNKYEALFSCLAELYNGKNGYGYVNNYLIGNEVNAFDQWHYTGSTSLETNANLYADTYQVVYMAVKSRCKNARVSICLDHSWNADAPGQLHSSRSFLDQFASRLKKYGSPNFTISYHAYPIPLTQADFWANPADKVKNSTDSPYITMKNIKYLTDYVKARYGSKTRIMLTEQGFSSHGANGEKKQAAAIAYAFYKAEFNSMIDCIIFRSQEDAQVEIDSDNLYMGLWTVGKGRKKAAYDVFRYMDTSKCEKYTASSRKYLGISKWSQWVPGYRAGRFKK